MKNGGSGENVCDRAVGAINKTTFLKSILPKLKTLRVTPCSGPVADVVVGSCSARAFPTSFGGVTGLEPRKILDLTAVRGGGELEEWGSW